MPALRILMVFVLCLAPISAFAQEQTLKLAQGMHITVPAGWQVEKNPTAVEKNQVSALVSIWTPEGDKDKAAVLVTVAKFVPDPRVLQQMRGDHGDESPR